MKYFFISLLLTSISFSAISQQPINTLDEAALAPGSRCTSPPVICHDPVTNDIDGMISCTGNDGNCSADTTLETVTCNGHVTSC
jgi:hypothetical protein